jgi:uncharacterized membrane protein YedE/YeeE
MNPAEFRISKTSVIAALGYPVLFLVLYSTLVAHLRLGIGRWPLHISDNPTTGLFHVHSVAAGLLFGFGIVLVPISAILAAILAFVPAARRSAASLAIFTLGCLIAFAVMHLAPNSFMTWWWD